MTTSRIRTIKFLPEIFQTTANEQFLNATLDQLVAQPKFERIQGYIGSKFGAGINSNNGYVVEPTKTRQDNQLTPAVTFLREDTSYVEDLITYDGILDALKLQGSYTENQDRLFNNQFYSWDPLCSIDMLVNYGSYYWLPEGPEPVEVVPSDVFEVQKFKVTRTSGGFQFSGTNGINPDLTLVRGGTYEFEVDDLGAFWIQGFPGLTGLDPNQLNVNTREIYGVTDNGATSGTVRFVVPQKDAQESYDHPGDLRVDLISNKYVSEIDGKLLSTVKDIDGVLALAGKTVAFYNNNVEDATTFYRIVYEGTGENTKVVLVPVDPIPYNATMVVNYGTEFIGRRLFKDLNNLLVLVPYQSAVMDQLYYQSGSDVSSVGSMFFIEVDQNPVIRIDAIVGQQQYTSPTGIPFTNGLKVTFLTGQVEPESYAGNYYFVEGVGENIQLIPFTDFVAVESPNQVYLPWNEWPWNQQYWDALLYKSIDPDYITINRASQDKNAWSRSNRWFHIDAIKVTAQFNDSAAAQAMLYDKTAQAKRPIIEFYPNMQLFNSGVIGQQIVDFFITAETPCSPDGINITYITDAFSQVQGQQQYFFDVNPDDVANNKFYPGATIVFAGDTNPNVRNTIYVCSAIQPEVSGPVQIVLTPIGSLLPEFSLVPVKLGFSNRRKSFYSKDAVWFEAQQKTTINQPPLFDVVNLGNQSFGNYFDFPSTTFNGCQLFGYTIGKGTPDPILGFPLSYTTGTNLGNINFTVFLDEQKFSYNDNGVQVEAPVNTGFVKQYTSQTTFEFLLGWDTAVAPSIQYQQFLFEWDTLKTAEASFVCDIPAEETAEWQPVQVYINNQLLLENQYTVTVNQTTTEVKIGIEEVTAFQVEEVGSTTIPVQILVYSKQVSPTASYAIPTNLSNNPFNQPPGQVSISEIRDQYTSIFENFPGSRGELLGDNNLHDQGNLSKWGTAIIQNSASLVLVGAFLRKTQHNLFDALQFNSRQYVSYKNLLIDTVVNGDFSPTQTPASILDACVDQIASTRSNVSPFFWTDMIPSGSPVATNTYKFRNDTTDAILPLTKVYNFQKANYDGVLIYLNEPTTGKSNTTQLLSGIDYSISETEPTVTIIKTIPEGSSITVNEYNQTYGSFAPATPTKLGMYQLSIPVVYLDETYQEPTYMLRGHDGSLTKIFGSYDPATGSLNDFRDQVMLEFETRVFNNMKISAEIALTAADVIPGAFRQTEYTQEEILTMYSTDFLNWTGSNRIDYNIQYFEKGNEWTWNYNRSSNKLNGDKIDQGYWRGMYQWFYDTDHPATEPWQMLGFSAAPTWWETRYGAAPYTSDNTLLWTDLELGYIWNDGQPYINTQFARPGLSKILPVDSDGNLLPPFQVLVGNYDSLTFRNPWVVGDDAPAEASYRHSSSWPFDLMRLLALTKPAQFFNLNVDIDEYNFNQQLGQFVINGRQHLDPRTLTVYGSGIAKHSYINWIVDFEQQLGVDAQENITSMLRNLDVRLAWRVAGYTAKNQLDFYIDKATPGSRNNSLLIPDENYQILLYDNVPFDTVVYSSIIVQRVPEGWRVWGNSQNKAFFTCSVPKNDGEYVNINYGAVSVKVNANYTDKLVTVPYGTLFYGIQSLSEFIMAYGEHLTRQGMIFAQETGAGEINWQSMIVELIYWAQTGWQVGSLVNLNPSSSLFRFDKQNCVVQPLNLQQQNFVLNQNGKPIDIKETSIVRLDTAFVVQPLNTGDAISYTNLNVSNFEHVVVFDNKTEFGDLIYSLPTGMRQLRMMVRGSKSAEWNGLVDAQGFIVNQDTVPAWRPAISYTKGAIVRYKNQYWSAARVIQARQEFIDQDWVKIQREDIQATLLPNPSTRAYESTLYYDTNRSNLELEGDLLGVSLIGYRPRDYLDAANLTDITKINVYQNMIKGKGTDASVSMFKNVDLITGPVDYTVFENWAILQGQYGGVLNHNFIELILEESKLVGNPATIQLTELPNLISEAQQVTNIKDLYNYGRSIYSPDVLPLVDGGYNSDTYFPTAGYVNFDDIKVYSWSTDTLGINPVDVTSINNGEYLWLANHQSQWSVFTPRSIGVYITQVINNMNGTSTVVFSGSHGLAENDVICIIDFNVAVNGYYVVASTNSAPDRVVISSALPQNIQQITGEGVVFQLVDQRVSVPSDIEGLIPGIAEFQNSKVWVDYAENNDWAVYRRTSNYVGPVDIDTPSNATVNFGVSADFATGEGLLIGDPGIGNAGYAYLFDTRSGVMTATLTSSGTSSSSDAGFGSSVAICKNVAAIGNSSSNYVVIYDISTAATKVQTISAPSGVQGFGKSLKLSDNGMWLYVGATDAVVVYQFDLASGQFLLPQNNEYSAIISCPAAFVGSGFGEVVSVDSDGSQIVISAQRATVSGQLSAGAVFVYTRALASFTYADEDVFELFETNLPLTPLVFVNGVQTTEFTYNGISITMTGTLVAGDVISVQYGNKQWLPVALLTAPQAQNGSVFGKSVSISPDGNNIAVGSPYYFNQDSGQYGQVFRFTDVGRSFGSLSGTYATANVPVDSSLFINGYYVDLTEGGNVSYVVDSINRAAVPNVRASLDENNNIVISLIRNDNAGSMIGRKISLYSPITTTGNMVQSILGINIIPTQPSGIIQEPHGAYTSQFGWQVNWNSNTVLGVTAPLADSLQLTSFDQETSTISTVLDAGMTTFIDTFVTSGAGYIFELLLDGATSISSPGQLTFAQCVNKPVSFDTISGKTTVFTNQGSGAIVGEGWTVCSVSTGTNSPAVVSFENTSMVNDWTVFRKSMPIVNIDAMNSVQIFSAATGETIEYLDYIDPLQGKLLGVVLENLDFTGADDPAAYSTSQMDNFINSSTQVWGPSEVGKIWFDTTNTRFVNYHQDTVKYNTTYWGQVFPGSDVAVYTWVASQTSPALYTGEVYSPTSYSISLEQDNNGNLVQVYYFWAKNLPALQPNKTLDAYTISQYISAPQNSGISWMAPVDSSTFAIYNSSSAIAQDTSALHVGFGLGVNSDPVHQSFQLIRAGDAADFLSGVPDFSDPAAIPSGLYSKYVNSFKGMNDAGLPVPNPRLPNLVKWGTGVRPEQSMFRNRLEAMHNFSDYVNGVIVKFPIFEMCNPTYLFKTQYASEFGIVTPTPQIVVDTPRYWQYINWWADGFSDNTKVVATVAQVSDLQTLATYNGMIVRVTSNSQGNAETWLFNENAWSRIGLENGTFQITSNIWDYEGTKIGWSGPFWNAGLWGEYPSIETGWIVRAVNEQIFIGEMLEYRNLSLIEMFKFMQVDAAEQQNYMPWLNKTSLVDVSHTLRELKPYTNFQSNETEFLSGYLNEVKPFHVVIKEFVVKYNGEDVFEGDVTDFDLPAQFSQEYGQFISPVLVYQNPSNINEFLPSDPIWKQTEYSQWFNNYGLSITESILLKNVNIGELTSYLGIGTFYSSFTVLSTAGWPSSGIVMIGSELIGYQSVDYVNNTISGLERGVDMSPIEEHMPGDQIFSDIPSIPLVSSGHGYTSRPGVRAVIDTTVYPEPRLEAQLEAVMNNGSVVGVIVKNAGSGYAVTPTIEIEAATGFSFAASDISPALNIITVPVDNGLVTGDTVKILAENSDTVAPSGVELNHFYFVRVVTPTTIALYYSLQDALNDEHNYNVSTVNPVTGTVLMPRVDFLNTGSGDFILVQGAMAGVATTSYPVRSMTVQLKFDSTSFDANVVPWEAGTLYWGIYGSQNAYSSSAGLASYGSGDTSEYIASAESYTGQNSFVYLNSQIYQCINTNRDLSFNLDNWQLVNSDSLDVNELDRIAAYYWPSANMPGRAMAGLVDGIQYPNAIIKGLRFNQTTELDVDLRSPGFTGTDGVYQVTGGTFSDGYAPPELVAGNITDRVTINVITHPGSPWEANTIPDLGGEPLDHTGYSIVEQVLLIETDTVSTYSFSNMVETPTQIVVNICDTEDTNGSMVFSGIRIYDRQDCSVPIPRLPGEDDVSLYYEIDWKKKTITIKDFYGQDFELPGTMAVMVSAYEIGGGNQIVKTSTDYTPMREYNTVMAVDAQMSDLVNIENDELWAPPAVFKNGELMEYGVEYTLEMYQPTGTVAVKFSNIQADEDYICVVLFGKLLEQGYGWSQPYTVLYPRATGSVFAVDSYSEANKANAVIEVDGLRIDPTTYVWRVEPGVGEVIELTENLDYQTLAITTYGNTEQQELGTVTYHGRRDWYPLQRYEAEQRYPERLWVTVNGRRVPSEYIQLDRRYGYIPDTEWSNGAGAGTFPWSPTDAAPPARPLWTTWNPEAEDTVVIISQQVPVGATVVITSCAPDGTPDQLNFAIDIEQTLESISSCGVESVDIVDVHPDAVWSSAVIEFSEPDQAGGARAQGQVVIYYDDNGSTPWGKPVGVIVYNRGSGYSKPATATITGIGTGTLQATAVVTMTQPTLNGVVYRTPPTTQTWLTRSMTSTETEAYVKSFDQLVNGYVQVLPAQKLVTAQNQEITAVVLSGVVANDAYQITEMNVSLMKNGLVIRPDQYAIMPLPPLNTPGVANQNFATIVFDADVTGINEGDEVELTYSIGCIVKIGAETIRFTGINRVEGCLTGLIRGWDGSAAAPHSKYDVVQGYLPQNIMPVEGYYQDWNFVDGVPLQCSYNPWALFLQHGVIPA